MDRLSRTFIEPRAIFIIFVLGALPVGIDPDIFFDDDGRVWYVGTAAPEKPNFPGEGPAPGLELVDLPAMNWETASQNMWMI